MPPSGDKINHIIIVLVRVAFLKKDISIFNRRMSFDEDEDELIPGRAGDEELTLPRAAINKMIKEKIPNVRVANEARELILQCSTEFIHLLSSEASEICEKKQQKKTITPEHALLALESLGKPSF